MWWIPKKYKPLRTIRKAAACWQRVTSQHPRLFAHWAWRSQVSAVALGTSGMSDPNAGRNLEAWLPSNLIWDRFPSDWTSRSPRHLPHTRYTNGAVTGVDANQWSVYFPEHYAPLSHLLLTNSCHRFPNTAGC